MAEEEQDKPKIQIDDDWKEEARREKEELAKEAEKAPEAAGLPEASFRELVNLLTMQAVASLGGLQTPDGKVIPPNFELAKHYIDLLGVLEEKTKGNLTEEEEGAIQSVLRELRMHYIQLVSGAGQAPPPAPTDEPPAT